VTLALHHFLIVYNVRENRRVSLDDFGSDTRGATAAYADVEEEYRGRSDQEDFEIVLVGADSLDTIRVTHSRYFDEDRQEVPF
jgi:hypothetical protein